MRKLATAILTTGFLFGSLVATTPEARADGGQIAAGVAGELLGGVLLGSALAGRRVYVAPPRQRTEDRSVPITSHARR